MVTIRDIPDSVWKKQFALRCRMHATWRLTAIGLHRSATACLETYRTAKDLSFRSIQQEISSGKPTTGSRPMTQEEYDVCIDLTAIRTYMLLMGLAIENLAKGILISANPALVKDNISLDKSLRHHNLVKFVTLSGVTMSDKEGDVLRMLTEHVTWSGCYPAPLSVEEIRPKEDSTGTWFQPGTAASENEIASVDRIYYRLLEKLNSV